LYVRVFEFSNIKISTKQKMEDQNYLDGSNNFDDDYDPTTNVDAFE
jgi:hypothetical protein